tara:strand:+ start:237 stop:455 length:219 start_codon:yes stop_codon:yes gene_type:complete
MKTGNKYIEAAKAHFEARKLEAEAVLETYLTNSVGIGEHSDLPEEVYKWVEKLASANDGLNALEGFLNEHRK